jgi:MoxR-like ATPase
MAEAARALALLAGRPSVGFEDVRAVAEPVLNHRLILGYQARLDRVTPADIVADVLSHTDEAGLDLPEDVTLNN